MKKTALWTLPLAFMLAFGLGYLVGESAQKSPIEIPAAVKQEVALASQPGTNLETLGVIDKNTLLDQILEEQTVFKMLAKTYALVGNMDQRSLEALILDAAVHDNELINRNVMTIGIRRLSEIDPHATMMFVLDNPELPTQGLSQLVAGNWLRIDPEGVVTYVVSLHNDRLQHHLASRLYGDPLLEAENLNTKLELILGKQAVTIKQNKAIRSAPPWQAFEDAMAIESLNQRRMFMHQAANRWAEDDPAAAVSRIQLIENLSLRDNILRSIFHHYAAADFSAALEFARVARTQNIGQYISALSAINPVQTLPLAEAHFEKSGDYLVLGRLIRSWAMKDFDSSLAYVQNLELNDRRIFESQIYSMLGNEDPQRAFELLEQQAASDPNEARRFFQYSINEDNLEYAEKMIQQTNNPDFRADLIKTVARRLSSSDPETALGWILELKGTDYFETAVLDFVPSISSKNPYLAQQAIEQIPNSAKSYWAMEGIVIGLYRRDAEETIAWVKSLPGGEARNGAEYGLIQVLAHKNPTVAKEYLVNIAEGYRKEEANVMVAMGYIQEAKLSIDDIITELDLSGATEEKVRTQARAYAANNND